MSAGGSRQAARGDDPARGPAPFAPGIADFLARHIPDPEKWAEQFAAHPVEARPVVVPLEARKLSAVIEVADELLSPRELPPPSWRSRLRWKRDAWRERAARRAFRVIAGYEVPELDW